MCFTDKFRMEDGTVIDIKNAKKHWNEATDWNGNNHISRNTKDQWCHQDLYMSRKGRYYVVHSSQWQGSMPHAEWVSPQEACRWLTLNDHEIPVDLKKFEEEVTE